MIMVMIIMIVIVIMIKIIMIISKSADLRSGVLELLRGERVYPPPTPTLETPPVVPFRFNLRSGSLEICLFMWLRRVDFDAKVKASR